MSSVINPVGPEEPSTYWRRRAVVIVALLVLLVGGFLVLRALFGGSDDQSATPPPTSSQSPAPGTGDPSPGASPAATPGSTASGVPACPASAIAVTAEPAATSTAVGKGLKLTMTIENTGKTACSRDVGAGANELQITSGSVLVWSSDFCVAAGEADVEVIDPGQQYSSTVSWPGTVVSKECPSSPPDAQAGSYKVVGRNGDIKSKAVAFTVA